MSIKEFIKAVQNRPLMYVEEIKIEYIYYLVVGFLGSNRINKAGYSMHIFTIGYWIGLRKMWIKIMIR